MDILSFTPFIFVLLLTGSELTSWEFAAVGTTVVL
jgi:hypothetical protein